MSDPIPAGTIAWIDLTSGDAERARDFYAAVVGWQPDVSEMDGYDDYIMNAADGQPVAGICHAKGISEDLPAQWLIYIAVADLDAALAKVVACGGEIVCPPREAFARFAVIRDPAGAVCAIYEPVELEGDDELEAVDLDET